jgi:hypothetical protein
MIGCKGKAAAALLALACAAGAGEGLLSFGLRSQGTIDFLPGQDWVTGPEAGYSNHHLFGHKLELKAAYLTSRLEWVFRPNVLRHDYFLFTPKWHFRRGRWFDPTVQADFGYTRFDVEEEIFEVLDNDSWIAAAQLGLTVNLAQGRYGGFWHFGCNFIAPETGGLVFPGVFGIGLWVML